MGKNNKINKFRLWLNTAIYDDTILIDEFLISICHKLIELKVIQKSRLFALKNGSTLCLYDSSTPNDFTVKSVDPLDISPLISSSYYVKELSGGNIEMYCQVSYKSRPIFVIHSYLEAQEEYIDLLKTVADTINLAFSYKEERRFDRVQKELIKEFFERGLQTQEAWKVIAEYSSQFLPDFSPYKVQMPPPLSQILTYKEGDLHLLMRANQSGKPSESKYNERLAIPIKVDESICGIVIEKKLDYLLCNPTVDYRERYQAYLFSKQLAKSELIFPIKYGNEIIAIINVEHPDEDVFSGYSVEAISRATKFLAPLVKAVIDREEKQRRKEISLLYVMTEVLARMASLYRHKIGQLLLKSRTVIEDLAEDYANDATLQQELGLLRDFIDDFDGKSKSFLRELPNYIKYQRMGISFVLKGAIKDIDAATLEKNGEIKIIPHYPENEINVYASPMLKEHIYNLLNNSIIAIRQRIAEKKQTFGTINIHISYQKVTDTLEKVTSPSRVYIKISDNGGGVSEADYKRIHEFGYTTRAEKGGTGYGLPSAREYVLSVHGGNFKTENEVGIGFSVQFFLQEFDPSFHITVMQ